MSSTYTSRVSQSPHEGLGNASIPSQFFISEASLGVHREHGEQLHVAEPFAPKLTDAAVPSVSLIVFNSVGAEKRRTAGGCRQAQRAAQGWHEDIVVFLPKIVLPENREHGGVLGLLRRLLHDPLGVPGAARLRIDGRHTLITLPIVGGLHVGTFQRRRC